MHKRRFSNASLYNDHMRTFNHYIDDQALFVRLSGASAARRLQASAGNSEFPGDS